MPVKTRIKEIADLLVVDRLHHKFGIESTRPTLHMSFTGSPGTGKTTVALRMAELLKNMGCRCVQLSPVRSAGRPQGVTDPATR